MIYTVIEPYTVAGYPCDLVALCDSVFYTDKKYTGVLTVGNEIIIYLRPVTIGYLDPVTKTIINFHVVNGNFRHETFFIAL